MKAMTDYFLRAAPWALCLMMVAPYLVYRFTAFGHRPLERGILVLYFLTVVLGWIYSVGNAANERLVVGRRHSPWPFRLAIALPFLAVVILLFGVWQPLVQGQISRPPAWAIWIHFSAIFSMAYCYWFAAHQFITLRQGRAVDFIDYYPAFMGFWFCFIGVWFLQPRIQQTFGNR